MRRRCVSHAVRYLPPSVPRLDAISVDPKVPSFRPFLGIAVEGTSLFPLHRRRGRQQIIFSFLVTRETGDVGSLHRLIIFLSFFTWPHARAGFAICSLHEVANATDTSSSSEEERERGYLIFPPLKEEGALERISEVGQNAASQSVKRGRRIRKDRSLRSFVGSQPFPHSYG